YQIGRPDQQVNIQPFYSVKGNLTIARLRGLIKRAISENANQVEELLPASYLKQYKLPERKDAIKHMHQPENRLQLKHARRRFVYEELLLFQLKITLLKQRNKIWNQGNPQQFADADVEWFVERLPFTLTKAQARSLEEILYDMKSPLQMNRLLQDDVRSGKTAVAPLARYASVMAGRQGALMVPTEVLAEQHYESMLKM